MPSRILRIRQLFEQRQFKEAWHYYLETDVQDPEWHVWGARTAKKLNLLHAARTAAEDGLNLGATGEQKAMAHFILGECNRVIGDLFVAKEQFEFCLDSLASSPSLDSLLRGPCLYNRALALYFSGHHAEAYESNEAALIAFRQENMPEYLRDGLINAAWYATELQHWDQAEAALSEAERLCTSDDSKWRYQLASAYLCHRQGASYDALQLIESLTTDWENGKPVPMDVVSMATAIGAEIGLNEGNTSAALTLANYAYDLAWRDPQDHRSMKFVAKVLSRVRSAELEKGA